VYYPTSALVTSFDIIFFWVARMIMMGLHFMEEIPFRDVYIHALVRDAEGQKMSKSRGNVIDPLEMTETYGTDAFRFTLAAFAAQGRDIKMSAERIEGYRNFANKIWNASRFVLMNLDHDFAPVPGLVNGHSSPADRWILSRLQQVIAEVGAALGEYRFNDAASVLYQFIWGEYCDWYVELSKLSLRDSRTSVRGAAQTALVATLDAVLRLLHPFMPFITEEIWQKLPGSVRGDAGSIMIAPFPRPDDRLADAEAERLMRYPMEATLTIRNIRGEMKIPPSEKGKATVRPLSEEARTSLERTASYVAALSGLSEMLIAMDAAAPAGAATGTNGFAEIYVLPDRVIDAAAERDRLAKEIAKLSKDIEMFSKKLANKSFVERAPKAVVEKDTARLEELKTMREKLEQSLAGLRS
jgi:valyl-tRNA synthetase